MKRLLYIILLLLAGCNGQEYFPQILEQVPEGIKTTENFWQTEEDFAASSRELHARLRFCFSDVCRRSYRDRALMFDFITAAYQAICNNELEKQWDKTNACIDWQLEYNVISEANQIIHYIPDAGIPEERKNHYLAEAVVIRAAVYLYLVQTWGNVPLVVNVFDDTPKAQTPGEEILDYMISEVEKVILVMRPASGLTDAKGNLIKDKQIPALGMAYMLLADMCAWNGSLYDRKDLLEKALKYADMVINSGEYEMVGTASELISVVLKGGSMESIWELNYFDNVNETNNPGSSTAYAAEKYPVIPNATPATKRRTYRMSFQAAKEKFNTCGDLFDEIFYNTSEMEQLPTTTTQGAAYIWKIRDILVYEDGNRKGQIRAFNTNEILYRLPDAILLRAELRYKLGDLAGAEADLNLIRKRCGADPYSVAEGDLLKAIIHQYEQEFFLEGIDKRMHMIVRNGLDMVREMLTGRFKTVESMDEIYLPISYFAFFRNPLLRQNPYWNKYDKFKIN